MSADTFASSLADRLLTRDMPGVENDRQQEVIIDGNRYPATVRDQGRGTEFGMAGYEPKREIRILIRTELFFGTEADLPDNNSKATYRNRTYRVNRVRPIGNVELLLECSEKES